MFELFLGGVVKHSKRAIALQVCIYDKSLIVTVESDTMETSLVHCLEHCYSCCALVTIRGNELVIFHGIALYSDDKYILLLLLVFDSVIPQVMVCCFLPSVGSSNPFRSFLAVA